MAATMSPRAVLLSMDGSPSSRSGSLVPIASSPPAPWQAILQASNQVVLYNPTSHALSVTTTPKSQELPVQSNASDSCPYCHRLYSQDHLHVSEDQDPAYHSRTTDYFQLLAVSNDTFSRPTSPSPDDASDDDHIPTNGGSTFKPETMADGYFNAFFKEECRLGMGANGSVYLCQVCK